MRSGIFLSIIALAVFVEVGRADIYWTDWEGANNVWRAGLDGSNPTAIVNGQFPNLSKPEGIDLDLTNGWMYVADSGGTGGSGSNPSLVRINFAANDIENITLVGKPTDVALDVLGGKVYWTDADLGTDVWRADLDGSNHELLISNQFTDLSGIALDLVNNKMYLTDQAGSVAWANLDGTGIQTLATGGRPSGVAVDAINNKFYWTDWEGENNVWQANLDGSNAAAIITSQFSNLNGIDVDPTIGKIYLADTGGFDGIGSSPSIASANLDGSGLSIIATGGRPSDVAIVPEPSTALLLAIATGSVVARRRRA